MSKFSDFRLEQENWFQYDHKQLFFGIILQSH
jgi:hypothetical protein